MVTKSINRQLVHDFGLCAAVKFAIVIYLFVHGKVRPWHPRVFVLIKMEHVVTSSVMTTVIVSKVQFFPLPSSPGDVLKSFGIS